MKILPKEGCFRRSRSAAASLSCTPAAFGASMPFVKNHTPSAPRHPLAQPVPRKPKTNVPTSSLRSPRMKKLSSTVATDSPGASTSESHPEAALDSVSPTPLQNVAANTSTASLGNTSRSSCDVLPGIRPKSAGSMVLTPTTASAEAAGTAASPEPGQMVARQCHSEPADLNDDYDDELEAERKERNAEAERFQREAELKAERAKLRSVQERRQDSEKEWKNSEKALREQVEQGSQISTKVDLEKSAPSTSTNPKNDLLDRASVVIDQANEFLSEVEKAVAEGELAKRNESTSAAGVNTSAASDELMADVGEREYFSEDSETEMEDASREPADLHSSHSPARDPTPPESSAAAQPSANDNAAPETAVPAPKKSPQRAAKPARATKPSPPPTVPVPAPPPRAKKPAEKKKVTSVKKKRVRRRSPLKEPLSAPPLSGATPPANAPGVMMLMATPGVEDEWLKDEDGAKTSSRNPVKKKKKFLGLF